MGKGELAIEFVSTDGGSGDVILALSRGSMGASVAKTHYSQSHLHRRESSVLMDQA